MHNQQDDLEYQLDQQDCLEWLREIPDRSIAAVIADPAYESMNRHREVGTTTRCAESDSSSNKWFETIPNEMYEPLCAEWRRILKRDGSVFLFGDQPTTLDVSTPAFAATGWRPHGTGSTTFRRLLVWDKVLTGMGYRARKRYELITWFIHSKMPVIDTLPDYDSKMTDILVYRRVDKGYPTEKPVELIRKLIRQSTRPGDIVIDCFAGSGSTGVAALLEGRRFAGCDISDLSIETAKPRLAKLAPAGQVIPDWPVGEQMGLFG